MAEKIKKKTSKTNKVKTHAQKTNYFNGLTTTSETKRYVKNPLDIKPIAKSQHGRRTRVDTNIRRVCG